ncbi:glycoside hydrolase family 5 protein [Rhodotorula paludigena]|uniref:glycoside hydrolase family 5 protein n=1 Tax=Rhodotorula paludigena TaxID=86838 RepID=UPI00316C0A77
MSSSGSHGRHRSSADMYASVPTQDGSYPPIRSITPRSPEVVHPSYASPPGPAFLQSHERSPSTNTFESRYSDDAPGAGAAPYRLRGGAATQSGTWDDTATGTGSYSDSPVGSSANLHGLAAGTGPYRSAPRSESYMKEYGAVAAGAGASSAGLATLSKGGPGGGRGAGGWWARKSGKAKALLIGALVALLVVIVVAIAVPVAVTRSSSDSKAAEERKESNDGTAAGIPTEANPVADWRTAAMGGNGSVVYMEDGSSFTYNNSFGGYWVSIPFNDTARAQRDVPALNEPWDYENNMIQGVNIGGWLVLEPFIVPGMFEPFNANGVSPDYPTVTDMPAIDEWTLCQQLGSDLEAKMTEHYETFITEKDFAEIAAAGLNWVRIPFGWWMIETWDGEPFLEGVAWTYMLKAIGWARKYGLRVNLDFHALPGSQNGYNHSGRQGSINFLNGVMGVANAQRALDYIRTVTEFISQPEYKNVVPMFSVMNEPYAVTIGVDGLRSFYLETYEMIRNIAGTGEGNGPWIVYHDGFVPFGNVSSGGWDGFGNGWDRVSLDSHRYLCFDEQHDWGLSYQATLPCQYWANNMNQSTNQFGLTMGGEWSLAINDCGKWLNNVGNGERYDGTYRNPGNGEATFNYTGSCDEWVNWPAWDQARKDGLRLVAETHMDALRHFFFWTWKTGYSEDLGMIANPMWNYQLGLQEGWVPTDPRKVVGACPSVMAANGVSAAAAIPAPTLAPWMTGGAGAGNFLDQAQYTSYRQFPPASIGAAGTPVSNLPTYTQTAAQITLSAPAQPTSFPSGYASSSVNVGDGWVGSSDTASYHTPVSGCTYPDPWSGAAQEAPSTAFCDGAAAAETAAARFKRYVKSTPAATLQFVPTPPPKPAQRA